MDEKTLKLRLLNQVTTQNQLLNKIVQALGEPQIFEPSPELLEEIKAHRPTYGVDYFTEEEQERFRAGCIPTKGTDYFTTSEIEAFLKQITPRKGIEYVDGRDGKPGKNGKKGDRGRPGKDARVPSVEKLVSAVVKETKDKRSDREKALEVVRLLESLIPKRAGAKDERLRAKAVRGLPVYGGGGTTTVIGGGSGTGDVVGPASATNNAVARFDGVTGKLIKSSTDVVILDSGRVGIGNTAPTELLHVGQASGNYLTVDGTGVLTITDDNEGISLRMINQGGVAAIVGLGGAGTTFLMETDANSYLAVQAPNGGYLSFNTSNTERMRISSGGAVGIGNTNPAFMLTLGSAGTGGQMAIFGSTSGRALLTVSAIAGTVTITMPTTTGTLALTSELHSAVTLAGENYITLSGQQITAAQINLASHVTGDLPFANLTQGSALSVLGVATNGVADVASIAAASDHQVLRRSGTSLAFGAIDLSQAAAVTGDLAFSNLAQGSALSVLGVTGNATADHASIAAASDHQVLRRSGTALAFGAINLASSNAVTGDLPFSNLAQGSALSVLGVTGNATADVASIAAASDHQVLRRSGTAVAFGAVNLAESAAVTGTLGMANGGTGATSAEGIFNAINDGLESGTAPDTNNTTFPMIDSNVGYPQRFALSDVVGAVINYANITTTGQTVRRIDRVTVTANTTMTNFHGTIDVDTSGGNKTISTDNGVQEGREIQIRKLTSDANTVTISTIEGGNITLATHRHAAVVSKGASNLWYLVSKNF